MIHKKVTKVFPWSCRRAYHHYQEVYRRLINAIKEWGPEAPLEMEDVGTCVSLDVLGTTRRYLCRHCHAFLLLLAIQVNKLVGKKNTPTWPQSIAKDGVRKSSYR